jgi:hypothetical protein
MQQDLKGLSNLFNMVLSEDLNMKRNDILKLTRKSLVGDFEFQFPGNGTRYQQIISASLNRLGFKLSRMLNKHTMKLIFNHQQCQFIFFGYCAHFSLTIHHLVRHNRSFWFGIN